MGKNRENVQGKRQQYVDAKMRGFTGQGAKVKNYYRGSKEAVVVDWNKGSKVNRGDNPQRVKKVGAKMPPIQSHKSGWGRRTTPERKEHKQLGSVYAKLMAMADLTALHEDVRDWDAVVPQKQKDATFADVTAFYMARYIRHTRSRYSGMVVTEEAFMFDFRRRYQTPPAGWNLSLHTAQKYYRMVREYITWTRFVDTTAIRVFEQGCCSDEKMRTLLQETGPVMSKKFSKMHNTKVEVDTVNEIRMNYNRAPELIFPGDTANISSKTLKAAGFLVRQQAPPVRKLPVRSFIKDTDLPQAIETISNKSKSLWFEKVNSKRMKFTGVDDYRFVRAWNESVFKSKQWKTLRDKLEIISEFIPSHYINKDIDKMFRPFLRLAEAPIKNIKVASSLNGNQGEWTNSDDYSSTTLDPFRLTNLVAFVDDEGDIVYYPVIAIRWFLNFYPANVPTPPFVRDFVDEDGEVVQLYFENLSVMLFRGEISIFEIQSSLNGNNGEWTNSDDVEKGNGVAFAPCALGSDCKRAGHWHDKKQWTQKPKSDKPKEAAAARIAKKKYMEDINNFVKCTVEGCTEPFHYHKVGQQKSKGQRDDDDDSYVKTEPVPNVRSGCAMCLLGNRCGDCKPVNSDIESADGDGLSRKDKRAKKRKTDKASAGKGKTDKDVNKTSLADKLAKLRSDLNKLPRNGGVATKCGLKVGGDDPAKPDNVPRDLEGEMARINAALAELENEVYVRIANAEKENDDLRRRVRSEDDIRIDREYLNAYRDNVHAQIRIERERHVQDMNDARRGLEEQFEARRRVLEEEEMRRQEAWNARLEQERIQAERREVEVARLAAMLDEAQAALAEAQALNNQVDVPEEPDEQEDEVVEQEVVEAFHEVDGIFEPTFKAVKKRIYILRTDNGVDHQDVTLAFKAFIMLLGYTLYDARNEITFSDENDVVTALGNTDTNRIDSFAVNLWGKILGLSSFSLRTDLKITELPIYSGSFDGEVYQELVDPVLRQLGPVTFSDAGKVVYQAIIAQVKYVISNISREYFCERRIVRTSNTIMYIINLNVISGARNAQAIPIAPGVDNKTETGPYKSKHRPSNFQL